MTYAFRHGHTRRAALAFLFMSALVSASFVSGSAIAKLKGSEKSEGALSKGDAWEKKAVADLKYIHDSLEENAPQTVVERDSARFRSWLDAGYTQAIALASRVHNYEGYYYSVKFYTRGFHDAHIQFSPNVDPIKKWPGFVIANRGGLVKVVYRSPSAQDTPKVGAVLQGCDGRDLPHLLDALQPFDDSDDERLAATFILWNKSNPFLPLPKQCDFVSNGHAKKFTLRFVPIPNGEFAKAASAVLGKQDRAFGLEPWGTEGFWISAPNMTDDDAWKKLVSEITRRQTEIRGAQYIVLDVRGNGGGSSDYAYQLARVIWGDEFINEHEPIWGRSVWRATPLIRKIWADRLAKLEDSTAAETRDIAELKAIVGQFDDAIEKHQKSIILGTLRNDSRQKSNQSNLVMGNIIVLTDEDCVSACLDLMDLFLRLPNVKQAGTRTGADTIFMEAPYNPLPSGAGGFRFGVKAWIDRGRASNAPYAPSPEYTWAGDPDDEAGIRKWLSENVFPAFAKAGGATKR